MGSVIFLAKCSMLTFRKVPPLWLFKCLCWLYHTDIFNPYQRTCSLILERGEEMERNFDVRNIDWLPVKCAPTRNLPETEPAAQACALTGNRTCDLSVYVRCSNQLSHTGQGPHSFWVQERRFLKMHFPFDLDRNAYLTSTLGFDVSDIYQ